MRGERNYLSKGRLLMLVQIQKAHRIVGTAEPSRTFSGAAGMIETRLPQSIPRHWSSAQLSWQGRSTSAHGYLCMYFDGEKEARIEWEDYQDKHDLAVKKGNRGKLSVEVAMTERLRTRSTHSSNTQTLAWSSTYQYLCAVVERCSATSRSSRTHAPGRS